LRYAAWRRVFIGLALVLPPAAAVSWWVAAPRDALVASRVYGRTRPTVEPIPERFLAPAARAVRQRLAGLRPPHPAPSAEALRTLERAIGPGAGPRRDEPHRAAARGQLPAAPVEDRTPTPEQEKLRLGPIPPRGSASAAVPIPAPSELPGDFTPGVPATPRSR
jgi:hypothetical protein